MPRGQALRDRTEAAIIDGAAAMLAERGEVASMGEIASSVGISRATLYRYFPGREQLLAAMVQASIDELAERIEQAELDEVPFEEALARLARAIIATGRRYTYVSGDQTLLGGNRDRLDAMVLVPIRARFRRAASEGALRADLSPELLMRLFSGLIRAALESEADPRRGVEETAAGVVAVFLHGAATP